MSRGTRDEEAARLAREVASRAVRRLGAAEWILLAVAVGLAIAGGAGVAWLLAEPLGVSLRLLWTVASLVLFVVPAARVLMQSRREDRASRDRTRTEDDERHV